MITKSADQAATNLFMSDALPDAAQATPTTADIIPLPLPWPDRPAIAKAVRCLFVHADPSSFVSLRGFDQFDSSRPPVYTEGVPAGDLSEVVERAVYGAGIVAVAGGVFAPPIATFKTPDNASEANLADGVAASVDLDTVNPEMARTMLESILGRATLVVSSGGEWFDKNADPEGQNPRKKLHLHWVLSVPARTPEEHAKLKDVRRWLTQLAGADASGVSVVHPFRWPGTLHLKAAPRFAKIEAQTEHEITLDSAVAALQAAADAMGVTLIPRTILRVTTRVYIEDDLPANVALAAELARTSERATPGEWHSLGFKLGCRMCRLAVSPETAVELLELHWVERGEGFKSRNRFIADVVGGYEHAQGQGDHGRDTLHAKFAGVVPDESPAADTMSKATETTSSTFDTGTADAKHEPAPISPILKLLGVAPVLPGHVRRPDPLSAPLELTPAAPMKSAYEFMDRNYSQDHYFTLKHHGGVFYKWRGTHYEEADQASLKSEIWRFLNMAQRVTKMGEGDRGGTKLAPFNPTGSSVANVLSATEAVANLDRAFVAPCWLEEGPLPAPRSIVACSNGLLNLATGQVAPATPSFFTLNSLPFGYDAAAPEPTEWLRFLRTLWPTDADSRDTLQEIFGLLLTAETRFQKAFLLVGPKRSGKGTIARVLTALLGQANVCGPTLGQLGQQFGTAPLIGKRLAIIADARLGGRADGEAVAERILNITGEDSQTIDRKFRDAWTGKLDARLLIISNELPRLADSSGALASRLITLVLTESFYGREDQGLTDRLTDELPGILNWAIAGWRRLAARERFNPPQASRDAQQELEDLGSPISVFVRERCRTGREDKVRPEHLFTAWRLWCSEQGRSAAQTGTQATFGRDLRAAIPNFSRRQETTGGVRGWVYYGVGLPSAIPDVVPAP